MNIPGIHHVTAIAGDPQQNVDFYTGLLGLRLVKLTVNFDDPGAYHLYYGDEVGHPGTILTFFAWPGAPHGRPGAGQTTAVSFSVPIDSLDYWTERLAQRGVAYEEPIARLDEQVLTFLDPDGLQLELVAHPDAASLDAWQTGPVPPEHAIRGFHSVTLSEADHEDTASLLTETMGLRQVAQANDRIRYQAASAGPGARVDVIRTPRPVLGRVAVGSVHHVAWRTPTDDEQLAWRAEIAARGLNVTPVLDRQYFHSIYFREPGGVLFEIATDPPGFAIDEPREQLGAHLKLPPWLEPMRAQIERDLPVLRLPQTATPAPA